MFAAPSDVSLQIYAQADALLRGADRRLFRASAVKALGRGAADFFRKKLGWAPLGIKKGLKELESGTVTSDNFKGRGCKPMETRFPELESQLRGMADPRSQTGKEARRQLIANFGYDEASAPSARSLRRKLSAQGFKPMTVRKSKPLRKIKETDAIFETVHRINAAAEADEGTVRLSIDTKTTVPIGNLSRGGKSRRQREALDHDLEPEAKLVPFGIHRPETAETWLCFTTGSVSSDFMADRLQELWPTLKKTVVLRIPW